jgi:AraC-like DNA-binding protein
MNSIDNILAVQKMQEYIDENLNGEITLQQLTKVSGYSSWHAMRIFKEFIGKTPFEYIRSIRMTKAALTLRDEEHKIIDVALNFVFDSHEGFTRAFSKEFGLPPKRYKQTTPPIQLFMPEKVYATYRLFHQGEKIMSEKKVTKTVFVQVIERPARKVLIKRGIKATEYYEYCEEVGCDIWALLCSLKEALYEPIGMWLPKHLIKEGTSKYVQGVELPLDYNNLVPEGCELIELPACKMMIFQGEPYDEADINEAIGEVWNTIEKYDPTIYGYKWEPELAPRFQLAPMGYRGYIEGRPVESVN